MSHQAINWAIEQRAGGPSPKATLWSIANYANENWCSWPSQATIAHESEQSLDTVQRRVRDLEQEGLVRRIPLHFAGRRTVDFFILKPSPFFSSELAKIEPLLPRGYTIAPSHAAASCGSAVEAKTQQASDVPGPDATANATANAAALLRQPMNLGTKEDDVGGVAREGGLTDQCFELAREIGKLCGYPEPIDWPAKWSQSHYRVQTWLTAGWSQENIIAAVTETMAGKRDGPPSSINYFDKPIAQFIGRRDAPLPQVQQRPQEIIDAKARQHPTASGWQGRRDAFADAHAKLREHNQRQPEAPGGKTSGGEIVQLAAAARRAGS